MFNVRFFELYGSCKVRVIQNKARSHSVMLVLGGCVIRSYRHALGCTGRCLWDSKFMSIGFFIVWNVFYLWPLIVEVGIYLKYAIFDHFYDVINKY